MRVTAGVVELHPSDLAAFTECRHASRLALEAARSAAPRRPRGAFNQMLIDKGNAFEEAFLAKIRSRMLDAGTPQELREILAANRAQAVAETSQAMREGVRVIYQPALESPGWFGKADFLERVDLPAGASSALGSWVYEPVDTKLTRSEALPHHALQLAAYAEALTIIQGMAPEYVHVQFARDGESRESIKLTDIDAYCRREREALVGFVAAPPATEPYPVPFCDYCEFRGDCEAWWVGTDHLSRVAGIRREQVDQLLAAGITTVAQLGSQNAGAPPVGLQQPSFRAIADQARLQSNPKGVGYELIDPSQFADGNASYGFAGLPDSDPGDMYLDLEGDPFWTPAEGLVFLFGLLEKQGEVWQYSPMWGCQYGVGDTEMRQAEEQALHVLMERFRGRLQEGGDWHVYHYGHAETSMLKRLVMEHGVHEDTLDQLLRERRFVDLSTVLRQSVRIGVESYSLKKVETLAGFVRSSSTTSGAAAVLEFESWLQDGLASRLAKIAEYNEEDCRATLRVHEWLLELRPAASPYVVPEVSASTPSDLRQRLHQQRDAMLLKYSEGSPEATMAEMLLYHEREERPKWWRYFQLAEMSAADLEADAEAIGGLTAAPERKPVPLPRPARSRIHYFEFPPQEFKVKTGDKVDVLFADGSRKKLDLQELLLAGPGSSGVIGLKMGAKVEEHMAEAGPPVALVPTDIFPADKKQERLLELAVAIDTGNIEYLVAQRLLEGDPPRINGVPAGGHVPAGSWTAIADAACALDESTLVIQGPPGTGKSFVAARIIARAVDEGLRVGITAPSHVAIEGLIGQLDEALSEMEAPPDLSVWHTPKSGTDAYTPRGGSPLRVLTGGNPPDIVAAQAQWQVAAGTTFKFSWADWRPDGEPLLDLLIVDEAGQMALADVLAVSAATKNLVLVGDPRQLPQVRLGVHPEGSGVDALTHALGSEKTIEADRGVFLDRTYRLHPTICHEVSRLYYEGRLVADASCAQQQAAGAVGISARSVNHAVPRASRSPEEAGAVAEIIAGFIGQPWIDQHGVTQTIDADDIMVITPFNAQVREIVSTVPAGVRVGTVDKFQGREAPVVIVSLASTSEDSTPRGLSFLLSENRLNVAVSRARCQAILVQSPLLAEAHASSIDDMRRISHLIELR